MRHGAGVCSTGCIKLCHVELTDSSADPAVGSGRRSALMMPGFGPTGREDACIAQIVGQVSMPYNYQTPTIAVPPESRAPLRRAWPGEVQCIGHRTFRHHRRSHNICQLWSARRPAVVRALSHPCRNVFLCRSLHGPDLLRRSWGLHPTMEPDLQNHPDDRYSIQGGEDDDLIGKDDHGSPVAGDSVC
jgi:hypothetical protein